MTVKPTPGGVGRWLLLGTALIILAGGAAVFLGVGRPSVGGSPTEREPPTEPPSVPVAGPAWFRDVTAGSGIDFNYRNGEEADQFTMLESLGGGVGLIDYDGDGRLDVFLTGGGYFDGPDHKQIKGHPCKLYRNLGGWKFRDVTEEAGLGGEWPYTHGCAVADYDRDGWPDLLVTGWNGLRLFHNEPDGQGGRRFVDVTEKMGLHNRLWSTSAGWADLDGDGWPDLYVCHYVDWSFDNHPVCPSAGGRARRDVCSPVLFKPLRHALFQNEKGKGFRDVTAERGLKAGNGLGVVLGDVNDDGRPDIYVANDQSRKFLYVNRGGGRLEEKAGDAGVALDELGQVNGSMGIDVGDYDGSGRASLWVTNFQNEAHGLYLNLGRETFQFASRSAGVAAIGQSFVSFGTGFVDVDGDGWEDLVIVSGHVLRYPSGSDSPKQRPVLLHNGEWRGRRFFTDASEQGGPFFRTRAAGRGLAIGDLDNDGRPDLVVSNTNGPAVLLRNEAGSARWLGVKLVGRERRDVVGSTAVLELEGGRRLTRFAKGGGSYLSASDTRLLFGLGESGRPTRLTVKWSWGESQSWQGLEPGAYWELREGEAEARRLPAP
jgi:hypothetical protein